MKVIIIGANGQLGSDIVKIFSTDKYYDLVPTSSSEINITKQDTIIAAIEKYKPEMIVSTAAYHHVDECETNPKYCFDVNAFGVRNLCISCKKNSITLVHFSTDYVFGSDTNRHTPYKETDVPGPINIYALSKLTGEYFVQHMLTKYFLIRTSGLYGTHGSLGAHSNFVDTVIRESSQHEKIPAVNDQVLSPTYTVDLASTLKVLLKTSQYGLYHITNSGQCSWFQFAKQIVKLMKTSTSVVPVSSDKFYTSTPRPRYSVLANEHLETVKLDGMKPWQDALKRYINAKRTL